MKTVNSYVRIFKERLEYIKGKKEKEEESKLNNPLPTIIPEQDVGETTGNGINFEILPNWEGSRDVNDIELDNENELIKSSNINKDDNYIEDEKNYNNESINDKTKKKKNKSYSNFEVKPTKDNQEFLLYNKFSQKPIMKIPNPYIKNSYQGLPEEIIEKENNINETEINTFNTNENINNKSITERNVNNQNNNIHVNDSININKNITQRENSNEQKKKINLNNMNKSNNSNIDKNNIKNKILNNKNSNNDITMNQSINKQRENEINNNSLNNYKEEINEDNNLHNNVSLNNENKNNNEEKDYETSQITKKKKKKIIPKNLNESDIISCSLSDDSSFNVTHQQMDILNKEANKFYDKLNRKLTNRIFNLKHPYLIRGNQNSYYEEQKKLLEPLIKKQKELLKKNLRKNKSKRDLDQSKLNSSNMTNNNNNNSSRDFMTQIPYYNNNTPNKNNQNQINLNYMNNMYTSVNMPQIQLYNSYNNLNNNSQNQLIPNIINQNLPIINNNLFNNNLNNSNNNINNNINNQDNSINKNNNGNLTKLKKIRYKPHTLKEYQENLKNSNYRYPASLGSNIGSPQWELEHKKLEKKFDYCKSVQKIDKDIKTKKLFDTKQLNKSEEKKTKQKKKELNISLENKNNIKENNNENRMKTEQDINKNNLKKLPPINSNRRKLQLRNRNIPIDSDNEEELNKIISQNKELGALLLSHDLYNSEVERIKQSL